MTLWLARLLLLVTVLSLWEWGRLLPFVGGLAVFDPFIVSKPSAVVQELIKLYGQGKLTLNIGYTLLATVIGLAAGLVTGLGGGLLLANMPFLSRVLEPFINVFNSVPRIVLAPYLFIALGIALAPRIVMAWSFVFFIVYFNVRTGLRAIDRTRFEHVRMLGARRRDVIRDLHVPVALAWTLRAFPQAVAYAFVGTVFQEFIGGNSGLGSLMIFGLNELNAAMVMGTIVILAALGLLLLAFGQWASHRMAPWRAELDG